MEPNSNQQVNPQQVQETVNQAVQQPVTQPVQEPSPAPTLTPMPIPEKKGSKKGIILILIVLILIIGIGAFVLFAKKQMNNTQKTSTNSTSSILPSPNLEPIASPTPASAAELNVESPDTDISGIEKDLQAL